MVSGIFYVFLELVVHDWSCAVEFIDYGTPIRALTTIGCSIIFLIFLKID